MFIGEATMKVSADVSEVELEGDYGRVEGLCLTCTRCGHDIEVFGTSPSSVDFGALTLREECPKREENYYEVD